MSQEAIFMFSPGGCAKHCPCTRCNDAEGVTNATPPRIVVTILGTPYTLRHVDDTLQVQNCIWLKEFSTPTTIGTCGVAAVRILLTISEDIGGTKYWLLKVQVADDSSIYEWFNTMTSQGACFTSQTLTGNVGTCTADNPISAALSMPDGPRQPCCPCTQHGSHASGGSPLPPSPPVTGPCPCCIAEPNNQYLLTFAGIQDSRPPSTNAGCAQCLEILNGAFVVTRVSACAWRLWIHNDPECYRVPSIRQDINWIALNFGFTCSSTTTTLRATFGFYHSAYDGNQDPDTAGASYSLVRVTSPWDLTISAKPIDCSDPAGWDLVPPSVDNSLTCDIDSSTCHAEPIIP